MTGGRVSESPLLLRGGRVLDVGTGEMSLQDVAVRDGRLVRPSEVADAEVVDADGLTICFGLWDCHAHPGSLMYDPDARGRFEGPAEWAVRAGVNLMEAVAMGVTGVRVLGEADGIDVAWSRAFRAGLVPGPRLTCSGQAIRTTGGHGTAYPRTYVRVQAETICDGPVEMTRAVRGLVERGVDWIKVMLTGGLYSERETVDGGQLTADELHAVVATATAKGVPVAAHCGSARWATLFAELGGRSVEHGYALDEAAAAAMARSGTWLVPTIGVTHDVALMEADGWPAHARERALATAPGHAEAVRACLEAGVPLATGADLNPIGPRLHAELRMLERIGLDRLTVLRAATAGARALNCLGEETAPCPGSAADLLLLEGNPLDDLAVLERPAGVIVFGRFVIRPGGVSDDRQADPCLPAAQP
ncbi:MAG TPA: amidohydrolase family protein [Gaiellaceae bacterium]|nr:amidohydrolase family protein [Gaiellaceae bacterium]